MKKLILLLTAVFMMVGFFSLPVLASRREHREHREHEDHDRYRDHDRHERHDDDRHERYEREDHDRYERYGDDDDDHFGRGDYDDDRHERYEHKYRDSHDDDDRYEANEHGYRKRRKEHGPKHHRKDERYNEHGSRERRRDGSGDKDRRSQKNRKVSDIQIREMVSASLVDWHAGEGWQKRKKGSTVFIVPLLYRDRTVGRIKVHPVTGEIMPLGAKRTDKPVKISLNQAQKTVDDALAKIKIGRDVRQGKRGFIWRVPLVLDGEVVERIKVAGNGDILPDAHMIEEVSYRNRKPPTRKGPSFY